MGMALGANLKSKCAKVFRGTQFICGSAVRLGVAANGVTKVMTR